LLKLPGLGRVFFKNRRGSQEQAIAYTKKGSQSKREWKRDGANGPNYGKNCDSWVEYGEPSVSKQGARTDLERPYELVKEGKTNTQIIEECGFGVFVRCYRALDRIRLEIRPEWKNAREVILIYGASGLGKTLWAYTKFDDLKVGGMYEMPISKKNEWYDGYANEETLLIDDFGAQMPLVSLLKLIDRYVRKVPVKGSQVWMVAKRIVITSNIHPSKWYSWLNREEQQYALFRRFTEFRAWTGKCIEAVDPFDFWPVLPPKPAEMHAYKPLNRVVEKPIAPMFIVTKQLMAAGFRHIPKDKFRDIPYNQTVFEEPLTHISMEEDEETVQ